MAVRDGPDFGGRVNRELWKPHIFQSSLARHEPGAQQFEAAAFADAAIRSGRFEPDQFAALVDYQLQRIQRRRYASDN